MFSLCMSLLSTACQSGHTSGGSGGKCVLVLEAYSLVDCIQHAVVNFISIFLPYSYPSMKNNRGKEILSNHYWWSL